MFDRFCKAQLEKMGVDTSMISTDETLQTGAEVLNFGEDK